MAVHPVVAKHPVIGADWNHWRPVKDYALLCNQIYFGIIKAADGFKYADGTRKDPTFDLNWSKLKQYGRARSAYLFCRIYKSQPQKAKIQVEDFFSFVEATGDLGELPFTLDIENIGFVDAGITEQEARDFIWKMLLRLEELSGKPHIETWIYTNLATWNGKVASPPSGNSDIPKKIHNKPRGLFVASWNNYSPSLPWDWTYRFGNDYPLVAEMWQFTNAYPFKGFEKDRPADGDVWVGGDLDDFNAAFGLNLQPLDDQPPVPLPPEQPQVVEIANLDSGEFLRVRYDQPWGDVRFWTQNGQKYDVLSVVKDDLNRSWFEIWNDLFVASWYCKIIE